MRPSAFAGHACQLVAAPSMHFALSIQAWCLQARFSTRAVHRCCAVLEEAGGVHLLWQAPHRAGLHNSGVPGRRLIVAGFQVSGVDKDKVPARKCTQAPSDWTLPDAQGRPCSRLLASQHQARGTSLLHTTAFASCAGFPVQLVTQSVVAAPAAALHAAQQRLGSSRPTWFQCLLPASLMLAAT